MWVCARHHLLKQTFEVNLKHCPSERISHTHTCKHTRTHAQHTRALSYPDKEVVGETVSVRRYWIFLKNGQSLAKIFCLHLCGAKSVSSAQRPEESNRSNVLKFLKRKQQKHHQISHASRLGVWPEKARPAPVSLTPSFVSVDNRLVRLHQTDGVVKEIIYLSWTGCNCFKKIVYSRPFSMYTNA